MIIAIFEEVFLRISTYHQLALFFAVFILSFSCFGSQLDCRSKTAYFVAKTKANYGEQIPNETIEFAKSAAMQMCISMTNTTKTNVSSNELEKVNKPKGKKRSILGINFGNSERKKGNERLMNRR